MIESLPLIQYGKFKYEEGTPPDNGYLPENFGGVKILEYTVTFPEPFASVPNVHLQDCTWETSPSYYEKHFLALCLRTVTETGFTARFYTKSEELLTTSYYGIYWLAVGQRRKE